MRQATAHLDSSLSADRLVSVIHGEIESLLQAVRRSDKSEKIRLSKSIEARLEELERLIAQKSAYSLTVDGLTLRIATLGLGAVPAKIAEQLEKEPGIGLQLNALRNKTVGSLDWLTDNNEPFSLVYYPPARVYLATAKGFLPSAGSYFMNLMYPERVEALSAMQKQLDVAWRAAHGLSVPIRQDLAERWKLQSPLLQMDYLDSELVPSNSETYRDLLVEVTRQLAYTVNVKSEGPPLIRALQAGLFFDEEFGFMAWGGR